VRSFFSDADDVADKDPIDRAIRAYQIQCESGEPSLERFWDGMGPAKSTSTLAALVKFDIRRRFRDGARPRAAEYLDRFPILAETGDGVVSLVYEEFCLLEESGEGPDSQDFCEAYSRWRDSLQSQLAYHRELSRAVGAEIPSVKFPSPGEGFGRYQLRSILGTGGVARVYLATEDDLGGRKLAIKVSASYGQEPSILGKLDHKNIVPILTVAESESGLRGICMPYRPGITLEELIRRIGRGTPPRSARSVWEATEPRETSADIVADEVRSGWVGFPIARSFSEAVAWIGLALADALSYLHGQGVFHRDIKPANVLLAYRDGPQLLDFNLAQDPSAPEHVNVALKGGTLPYMAPEQLKAFLDPDGWDRVGAAADLYSLGLVLKELVTGQPPEVPDSKSSVPRGVQSLLDRRFAGQTSIREINPAVPPALASIIEKCLAADPAGRHASASDLASDLRLFLERKPLEHAPNTSRAERAVNWFLRHRSRLASAGLTVAVLSVVCASWPSSSIPNRRDFQRAELLLDSNRPDDWGRARDLFERLHRELPASAWPSLYLGLTLQKIGDDKLKQALLEAGAVPRANAERLGNDLRARANDLTLEALKCADAEAAITSRLEKAPDSAGLLTDLGLLLYKNNELDRARAILSRSLLSEPNRTSTLAVLVEVERKSRHYEAASRYVSKLILLLEKHKLSNAVKIHEMRKVGLGLLRKLADRAIDEQDSVPERARAAPYLDSMKATLGAFREDAKFMSGHGGEAINRFTELMYESSIASCEAVLAADKADLVLADRRFDEARQQYEQAVKTLSAELRENEEIRSELDNQARKLDRRREKFGLSRKSTPLSPVGGC
jgi:serine/threonine protein kinase